MQWHIPFFVCAVKYLAESSNEKIPKLDSLNLDKPKSIHKEKPRT